MLYTKRRRPFQHQLATFRCPLHPGLHVVAVWTNAGGLLCPGLDRGLKTDTTSVRSIIHRVPSVDRDYFPLPDGVRYFCLPEKLDLRLRAPYERMPSFHSFTLTGGDGSRAFGFALTTYEPSEDGDVSVPLVYCFISHFPFFSLFKHILGWIYYAQGLHPTSMDTAPTNLRRCILPSPRHSSNNQQEESSSSPWPQAIADFVLSSPAPHGGSILDIRLGEGSSSFAYQHALLKSSLPPVDDMCFQLLFQHLSVKNILTVLNCLLLEQRILVHSSHHGLLTPICEALCALLFPFVWEHVYIPMLPMKLIDYLQAPVPFFMGVHTSYLTTRIGADAFSSCVVVHVDKDKVVQPIHSGAVNWSSGTHDAMHDFDLVKFPAAPLATLINDIKAVLDQYQPRANAHTAASNRIRTRRKARTSDALCILKDEEGDAMDDARLHAAPEVEITFGPGPLGITFESTHVWLLSTGLAPSDADSSSLPSNASAVVKAFPQLQNGLPGPAALSGLIAPGSYLLSVNDHSTLHLSFEATCDLLRHEPRPLVLRFQNSTHMPYHNALQFAARVRASSLLSLSSASPRPRQCLAQVEWIDAVRAAFAQFFLGLLRDVAGFVSVQPLFASPETAPSISRRHSMQRFISFDRARFIASQPKASAPFLAALCDTQTFIAFVNDTAVGQLPHLGLDSPFVDLFHECAALQDQAEVAQRLARHTPDETKRVLLHCPGWPAPETPTSHASPQTTLARLLKDLELEMQTTPAVDDVILMESPQKRQSMTRQLEKMMCGGALELDQPRRRRSVSDSAAVELEEELQQALDDEDNVPVRMKEQQPQDDTGVQLKKPRRFHRQVWSSWRFKPKKQTQL
ncbi:hypothetical protein AeRB84_014825 [Aphanomyces euteiches]|nr:hypothetical protein AeRB84_014825 [Aphanomyces euteiches]